MQNAGSLVVLGSINADHILNLQSFPTPGETVTGNHYQVAFGGKGANQAVAAGRSGANIAFIACTGDDSIGESVRQQLATDNIDITPVSVIKGESTGVALIFVNGEGENVIGIHAGANAALSPALVEAQRERIANASALLMQLESPLESVMAAAKIAHQNKTIVALNPAPARERSHQCCHHPYFLTNCWHWWTLLRQTKRKQKSSPVFVLKMMKMQRRRRRYCMKKVSVLY